ncbi:MAG: hypothetical protein JWN40_2002 [Phycisphaerales bacterium]|nr:hypothetical protein [Phycisphaerales bacterium]
MKSAILWALGALNVLLAIVLINKFVPEQRAVAQVGRPSDYIMVPAQINGISGGVVIIVDTSKGELSAMSYNDAQNLLEPMPKIDLNQVFKVGGGIGPGPGANKLKPR